MYLHISKNDEELELVNINRHGNMVSASKRNRPIVVLNFNPHRSFVIYPNRKIFTKEIKTEYYTFITFNFTTQGLEEVQVFILEHFYQPLMKPKFIVSEQKQQVKDVTKIYKKF